MAKAVPVRDLIATLDVRLTVLETQLRATQQELELCRKSTSDASQLISKIKGGFRLLTLLWAVFFGGLEVVRFFQ